MKAEWIMQEETDMDGVDCYIRKGELIRCKDCKYNVANMEKDPLDMNDYTDIVCSYFMTDGMEPYDFCSKGELYEKGWNNCLDEITDYIGESTEKFCNDDLYESWMFFDEGETE